MEALPTMPSIEIEGELNAVTASPDRSFFCVAGRSVFRLLHWGTVEPVASKGSASGSSSTGPYRGWKEVANFRGARSSLNATALDCKWHPMAQFHESIASAPTNGAVVLWNVRFKESRFVQRQMIAVMKEHTRTVNRVNWHPTNGYLLFSGSQDATVKLWDTRNHTKSSSTFRCASEVRDVQLNPQQPSRFVTALENGTLQIWDVRNTSAPESSIVGAHQGFVLTIAWHPDLKDRLASGGRDGKIKIWDTSATRRTPTTTIQTLAVGVGRVSWRPGYTSQLASVASLTDFDIHIWDVDSPYVPLGTLGVHSNVVSGIQWHLGGSHLVSCGKDGMLIRHNVETTSKHPYADLPSTALAWSPTGGVAHTFAKIDRTISPAHPYGRRKTRKLGKPRRVVNFAAYQQLSFDHPSVIEFLSTHYKFVGGSVGELCTHNAEVARAIGQDAIAQSWELFKIMETQGSELFSELAMSSRMAGSPSRYRALGTPTSGYMTPAMTGGGLASETEIITGILDDDVIAIMGALPESDDAFLLSAVQ
eukprot:TRINITY_DN6069_c0_g1_i1.p1 TRINITY_DN6069_c0_g1~~TRINITY_DN6069_c0_g1_i1.p1  ORF type:complete len:534 (+),score=35.48 TRINITY_DN6069_c0_g1_i1:80-1681(+)